MARITAEQAGGQNVVAFLDMIAYSELKPGLMTPTTDDGYRVIVGSTPKKPRLTASYASHPAILVTLSPTLKSTAAGRYQFLRRTWTNLQQQLGLPDFSPLSQDRGCIELIRGRGALDEVQAGRFDEAVALCSKEWASLPGAGYGQHENKHHELLAAYQKAGGSIA